MHTQRKRGLLPLDRSLRSAGEHVLRRHLVPPSPKPPPQRVRRRGKSSVRRWSVYGRDRLPTNQIDDSRPHALPSRPLFPCGMRCRNMLCLVRALNGLDHSLKNGSMGSCSGRRLLTTGGCTTKAKREYSRRILYQASATALPALWTLAPRP
ncbi:hypothetical protein BDV93DRAFT_193893 [Ceratobasidium sp. AG-I]|nr:hypothetical protein BDV93DRAFT_193893 [Ceratobasidium sp. AG-I]